jgi:predicted dehydrogenase
MQQERRLSIASRPNRRAFMHRSASAITVAALAANSAWAIETAPKKVRLGIVGGGFGRKFLFHLHPDCVVKAVSDLRSGRRTALMEDYNCETSFNSLEELVLSNDVDAVAIFTDGPLHVDHVAKAMKSGKHVLSAVPAAWGTLEQAQRLHDVVTSSGLSYMMAETSYYQQATISARRFFQEGKFGNLFYGQSCYQHPGLESLYFDSGKRTWRHGMAPMHYPTHCTAHWVSVTGKRLTEVVCHGWGDDDPVLKDNAYKNPFWNETASFKTENGLAFDCRVWWRGAHMNEERAEWIGDKMSFYGRHPNGQGPMLVHHAEQSGKDDAGYAHRKAKIEPYEQTAWWKTDMLPEPLRKNSSHQGSHAFLTHEFIDSVAHQRRPSIDVQEALAYTVPGIMAHQSALAGGERLIIPSFDRNK